MKEEVKYYNIQMQGGGLKIVNAKEAVNFQLKEIKRHLKVIKTLFIDKELYEYAICSLDSMLHRIGSPFDSNEDDKIKIEVSEAKDKEFYCLALEDAIRDYAKEILSSYDCDNVIKEKFLHIVTKETVESLLNKLAREIRYEKGNSYLRNYRPKPKGAVNESE